MLEEIDEMRKFIGNKKTTAGSGFLFIKIGTNSSIALLASETFKQEKNFGANLQIKV